ncbi:hypothetical protein K4F52_003795 [Lecanicillium sp. MT-2017a]|nr:hypothetical protein K4F52_003795 [Lecanicillium sp. MT-2017a]
MADERPSVGEGAGVSTFAGEPAGSHNRQPGDGVRVSFNGEPADADQLYEDRAAESEILLNSVSSGSLREGLRRERIGFEKAMEEARKKAAAARNIPERQSRDENPEAKNTQDPVPQLPGDFPAFHCTHRMNDIGAYLANASYVLSICGPPVAELNYGIIIYPAGEERMIFGQGPYFSMDQELYDRIADANSAYSEALRMHDPEKDSDEFARHRFDDQFTELSFKDFHNVEQLGPSGYAGAVPLPTSPTSPAGPSSNKLKPKGKGRAPVLKKPPGQAKGQRRSPRISLKIQQQEYLEMNEKVGGEKVNKGTGNAHVGATKRRRKA